MLLNVVVVIFFVTFSFSYFLLLSFSSFWFLNLGLYENLSYLDKLFGFSSTFSIISSFFSNNLIDNLTKYILFFFGSITSSSFFLSIVDLPSKKI